MEGKGDEIGGGKISHEIYNYDLILPGLKNELKVWKVVHTRFEALVHPSMQPLS